MTDPDPHLLVPALREGAARLGFPDLGEEAAKGLLSYLQALLDENERVNLVGPIGFEEALARHLLDALAIGLHLAEVPLEAGAEVADLGTGGGFPGVGLAFARPELRLSLVEGRSRKTAALSRLLELVPPPTLPRVVTGRFRELVAQGALPRHGVALVLARAVTTLAGLLEEAAAALRPGGHLVALKSRHLSDEERAAGLKAARRFGYEPLPDLPYEAAFEGLLVRYRKS